MIAFAAVLAFVVMALLVMVRDLRRRLDDAWERLRVLDDERAYVRIQLLNIKNEVRRHEVVCHPERVFPPPPRHLDDGPRGHRQIPPRIHPRQYLPDLPG